MSLPATILRESLGITTPSVYVLGMGTSGYSAAKLLLHLGMKVHAFDREVASKCLSPSWKALLANPHFSCSSDQPPEIYDHSAEWIRGSARQLLVTSPGIAPAHPLIQAAHESGKVESIGELELGLRFLRLLQQSNFFAREAMFIGITGTKGKTSLTKLIERQLLEAGRPAFAVGNVAPYGSPLCERLVTLSRNDSLVIEMSSYQLEDATASVLDLALLLPILPDHLDRHGDFSSYQSAKLRIANLLKESGSLWIEENMQERTEIASSSLRLYRRLEGEAFLSTLPTDQRKQILGISGTGIAAGRALCSEIGISDSQFITGLQRFSMPPHRLQWLGTEGDVDWYDDSKATTPEATLYAIERLSIPLLLIAGGVGKGNSFLVWKRALPRWVYGIVLLGEMAEELETLMKGIIPTYRVETIEAAVVLAKKLAVPHSGVLLSPGCASWDQFASYVQRGERFQTSYLNCSRCGPDI